MAPFAHYAISTTRAQDSAVSHQTSVPRIMAGNCRLRDFHWRSKWRSMFGGQLPKSYENVEGVVYITISISCSSHKYACFALRHCNDAGCDGLATCMSTITHRTLNGATKRHYIMEDRSRHSCCHLWVNVNIILCIRRKINLIVLLL